MYIHMHVAGGPKLKMQKTKVHDLHTYMLTHIHMHVTGGPKLKMQKDKGTTYIHTY